MTYPPRIENINEETAQTSLETSGADAQGRSLHQQARRDHLRGRPAPNPEGDLHTRYAEAPSRSSLLVLSAEVMIRATFEVASVSQTPENI